MSDAPKHTAFFGDADRAFALPAEMIAELERKTGRGIGGLSRDLIRGEFRHVEVLETIRLALIGGGEAPEAAAALIAAYAANAPVMTTYPLAVAILETVYFGKATTDAE
ncbi:gene transfer agent family protein [Rhizobium sp. GN54]|uniref:gene transfer agent family protein n=1 Tax=Rhizobium sp. GN54 TaxID=2898150 RepID=UPI001E523980|nr:gene transfer agent family protein [Rhizobium sp. GN54]MCD2185231.1 gene transfer agent family protein [Rhizobium sp. GN54]